MGIFAMVLQSIMLALPGLVQFAEDLHTGQPGKGPDKSKLVMDAVTTGAAVAGVVDPAQQSLIQGISQVAINGIVAVKNATGQFQTSAAAPAPAATTGA